MTLATRYLIKRLLLPFLVAFCIFTGVLLLVQFFDLTELIVNKGVPFRAVFLVLLTKIPETFSVTVPMSLIMAVIMTFGRLAEDNELTALRMAGYPLHWMLVPPLLIGLVLASSLVTIHEYGLPQLSEYKQQRLSQLETIDPLAILQPQTYLEIPPYTLYAEEIDGRTMRNVWIEDRRSENPQIIIGRWGEWIQQGPGRYNLRLKDGTLHQKTEDGGYRILDYSTQTLEFKPNIEGGSVGSGEAIEPLSEKYRAYRKLGRSLSEGSGNGKSLERKEREHRTLRTEFHRTIALPFATFFLVLVTAPTGLLTKHYGTVANLIFCLGIFFVYYILLTLAEPLATMGYVDPALAMWSPNVLLGTAGLVLFQYIRRHGI